MSNMTEREKAFASAFAEAYDITAAAASADITEEAARAMLAIPEIRTAIDDSVIRRADSAASAAARRAAREFERIAFSDDDSVRPADRLRAVEQLIKLAPDSEDGGGLIINYDYKDANDDA